MNPFDYHLQYIHGKISIDESDRQPYTRIFERVRDWLIRSMCDINPVFKKLYKSTRLFGSYVNRVRIIEPSEFDVFIVLEFPYEMSTVLDKDRPGFVHLDLEETLEQLANDYNYFDVYKEFYYLTNNRYMLKRDKFQRWITDIIEEVFENCPQPYDLEIKKKPKLNVAHTLYVQDVFTLRRVSIDFVPAFRVDKEHWMHIRKYAPFDVDNSRTFLAIPKSLNGTIRRNSILTFQLVNPEAEREILWDHQNLKVVYRLLKSLRNEFGLRRIKSYFLTTIFLWMVQKTDDEYWQQPVSEIFVDMLGNLSGYFDDGYMPYFWAKNFNLLSIMKPEVITEYAEKLDGIWKTLKTYPHQPLLNYGTTAYYFEYPSDSDSSDSY